MHTVLVDGEEYEVKPSDSIYIELSDQGKELPHGCLSGACSACKIEIIEGAKNLSEKDPIEANTLESVAKEYPGKEIRLSCRAKLKKGSVTIKTI